MPHPYKPTQRVLLQRRGLAFPPDPDPAPTDLLHVAKAALGELLGTGRDRENTMRAVDLQLAGVGHALSTRLRDRLAHLSIAALTDEQQWLWETLATAVGGHVTHTPLFRRFPNDIPADTTALWLERWLIHFMQTPDQPCLFCRRVGTTHVLSPCRHVVCDQCFDGANYSACPICGAAVDRPSPFFQPDPPGMAAQPVEPVRLKLIDWGEDLDAAAEAHVRALCDRPQAMSPQDRDDLVAIVQDYGAGVLAWLPDAIPVRETAALVLATLCAAGEPVPPETLALHLTTATDVLRFLAAYSGEDPSLQGQQTHMQGADGERVARTIKRFKVAKLPRSLRKRVLGLLERVSEETLIEDMLRHRSYWVWLGEFLHPHEYATRFPRTAGAFQVVRKQAPDGTRAPAFRGRGSRLEAAISRRDAETLIPMLSARPGELARGIDHALRLFADDAAATERLVAAFVARLSACATPVLLTLHSLLPTRLAKAPLRVYWPKGAAARGVSAPDERAPLAPGPVNVIVHAIEAELLARFAKKPACDDAVIDRALAEVVVPFNERTASRSAIALPRGSRVALPEGKTVRLFLHWCQPDAPHSHTDLDLSVAFYDAAWQYVGVCSYYQLKFPQDARPASATSAGDRTSAPFPDGASEFIDLDREMARAQGVRYAVMVVNAYAGLPFNALDRAFAGLMLRDDVQGAHFDARTARLKFALAGENGVFVPMVLDLDDSTLHWLDLYAKGEWEMNNVETSRKALARVCPDLITYFATGLRPSMYGLSLLHAAARAERVYLRGAGPLGDDTWACVERQGDDAQAFLARLRQATDGPPPPSPPGANGRTVLAMLHTGDMDLPVASARYCLFPERVTGNMAASDLLS